MLVVHARILLKQGTDRGMPYTTLQWTVSPYHSVLSCPHYLHWGCLESTITYLLGPYMMEILVALNIL